MPTDIITSIHGRRFGLAQDGAIVLNKPNGAQEVIGGSLSTTISSAQLLALFTTGIVIVPAAPAGYVNILERIAVRKLAGTAYTIGSATGIVAKYTSNAGQQISSSITPTGFLDQATEQARHAWSIGSTGATAADQNLTAGAANPIVLSMLGANVTGGNSALWVRVWYSQINTGFTNEDRA